MELMLPELSALMPTMHLASVVFQAKLLLPHTVSSVPPVPPVMQVKGQMHKPRFPLLNPIS